MGTHQTVYCKMLFTFGHIPSGVATVKQPSLFSTGGLAESFLSETRPDTILYFMQVGDWHKGPQT